MSKKACTHCSYLSNWSGLLIVIDPENSDVAKELGITVPGEYALRVK